MAADGSVLIKVTTDAEPAEKTLQKFSNGAKIAFAAATAAIGVYIAKTLEARGALEQNIGGAQQVFQESFSQIEKQAAGAFDKMGLSASDFYANANKLGALLQGSGFGIPESADLAVTAMQRASDVASIMGLDISAAMEAVTGAAKGNFTMMDNLGVAINATTIEEYALSKGVDKAYNSMSNQEKVGLAMELFLERTAYAAGNYTRENKTLAGALNTAKGALDNFLSGAGDAPTVFKAFGNAGRAALRTLSEAIPSLKPLTDFFTFIIDNADIAAAIFGVAAVAIIGYMGAIAVSAAAAKIATDGFLVALNVSPIGLAVSAVTALIAALAILEPALNKPSEELQRLSSDTSKLKAETDDLIKSLDDSKQAYDDSTKSAEAEAEVSKRLADRLAKLVAAGDKSAEGKAKLRVAVNQLNESMGKTVATINAETGELDTSLDAIVTEPENIQTGRR